MGTGRYIECTKCDNWSYPESLFLALREIAESGSSTPCGCGARTELHLDFNFATDGSGPRQCVVRNAFLPKRRPSWKQGNQIVEFFPFLVFLEQRKPYGRAVWLPYWHVKRSKAKRTTLFGQWAPFMGQDLYRSLLRQARAAGCIK